MTEPPSYERNYLAANRANWDDRTDVHLRSRFYDVERRVNEARGPRKHELEALGEIFTALLRHGLELDWLTEHDWTGWPRFPGLVETADDNWTTPPGSPRLPLSFSLLARRPPLAGTAR